MRPFSLRTTPVRDMIGHGATISYQRITMTNKQKQDLILFFIVIAAVSVAMGFYEGLLGNYFKDVYNVDGYQRGLLEFPRELPGVLCFFLISAFAFFGDITIAIVAQALSAIGLTLLGLITPSFGVMMVFVFIGSMGLHLYMPLRDSIGMALAEPNNIGKRMGQYAGVRFAFLTISGLIVFFLFRFNIFSFDTNIKWTFIVSAVFFIVAFFLLIKLKRDVGQVRGKRGKFKLLYRREYKFYYVLAIVFGVQKQVMLVFGPWVLIETLGQKVDVIVLLGIIASLLGAGFMPMLGRWIDRFGVKKLLFADAISFIVIYLCYGLLCQFFDIGLLEKIGLPVVLTAGLFVLDRLSSQMGIIRTVYLKSIAVKQSDITPTLSLSLTLDHIVSVAVGFTGGIVWVTIGSQYIFYIVSVLSLVNLFVAIRVKEPNKLLQQKKDAV